MNSIKEASKYQMGPNPNDVVDNHLGNPQENIPPPDPFLFSNCKVMTGQGKALVCQVGENTLLSKSRKPEDLVIKEEVTYLEQRLEDVAK